MAKILGHSFFIDIGNTISELHDSLALHVPFLYAIFYGAGTMHGHSDPEITHQMLDTVFEYPPDQIGFAMCCVVAYVICGHDLAISVGSIE